MKRSGCDEAGVVFVVDDEEPVRDSIGLLLRSVGVHSHGFSDARAFLDGYKAEQRGCLMLDIRMPRMSGLELQQELNRRGWVIPIIFITGHGDVPMAVEATRAGRTASRPHHAKDGCPRLGATRTDADSTQAV